MNPQEAGALLHEHGIRLQYTPSGTGTSIIPTNAKADLIRLDGSRTDLAIEFVSKGFVAVVTVEGRRRVVGHARPDLTDALLDCISWLQIRNQFTMKSAFSALVDSWFTISGRRMQ